MASNPQEAFLEILLDAMKDSATEGKLTQIQTTIDPDGKGIRVVRIIVIPEQLDIIWPHNRPLGAV